jgi:hypothetical protein
MGLCNVMDYDLEDPVFNSELPWRNWYFGQVLCPFAEERHSAFTADPVVGTTRS